MRNSLKQLDELLRGDRTRRHQLAGGTFDLPLRVFVPCAIGLGGVYGLFMGWFAVSRGSPDAWRQMLASTVKLPALFLLTLLVTFPSLYVFGVLAGSKLTFRPTLRLIVAAIVVNLAVGASLGPIVGFFTLSTTSYPFMVLLNVVMLGIAGFIGLGFLMRTLNTLVSSSFVPTPTDAADTLEPPAPPAWPPAEAPKPPAITSDDPITAAGAIFRVWIIIYGLVGAQMGWLLRPFIGHPGMEFTWFRPRSGSFFEGVASAVRALFSN